MLPLVRGERDVRVRAREREGGREGGGEGEGEGKRENGENSYERGTEIRVSCSQRVSEILYTLYLPFIP